jgi:hypothetical protein
VYLGLGGREFYVDSPAEDFERGKAKTYIFGQGANVNHPANNNPNGPFRIDHSTVTKYPTYIRFEQGDGGEWLLERATVTVHFHVPGSNPQTAEIGDALEGGGSQLWLGSQSGKILYLRTVVF